MRELVVDVVGSKDASHPKQQETKMLSPELVGTNEDGKANNSYQGWNSLLVVDVALQERKEGYDQTEGNERPLKDFTMQEGEHGKEDEQEGEHNAMHPADARSPHSNLIKPLHVGFPSLL
jgi:hypothetical protein